MLRIGVVHLSDAQPNRTFDGLTLELFGQHLLELIRLNRDLVEAVLDCEFEDAFETSIPDDQAENIKTVGQAIEFIAGAQGTD